MDYERKASFTFRRFAIDDRRCGLKIGTDAVALGAWASCRDARTAIDVGCGCGIIALMIAQRSDALITAIEIDSGAAADARGNIAASPWSDRIKLVEGDFADYRPDGKVDLIVSNPPFFANGEQSPLASRACARHEGGLNYSTLIEFAAAHLSATGRLAFIYPAGCENDIIYKAEMSHLKLRRFCRLRQRSDLAAVRDMYEFSPTDGAIENQELTIRSDNGGYTDQFAELTKDFYL